MLEEEIRKYKQLEAEFKRLRRQGKDTNQIEAEMEAMKKANALKSQQLKASEEALAREIQEKATHLFSPFFFLLY